MITRVQIPAYTDHWMRGDRFGNIIKVTRKRKRGVGDKRDWLPAYKPFIEIAHVLLDKSNKVVRVILADCEVVS